MSDDDREDTFEVPYRRSRRDEAITIVGALLVGLVVYAAITGVPGLVGIAGTIPASPGLIAIVLALIAYFLLDAWLSGP